MTFSGKRTDEPFAADGGLQTPPVPIVDPFRALDDLMAVVEVLSPTWPERDRFGTMGQMLL